MGALVAMDFRVYMELFEISAIYINIIIERGTSRIQKNDQKFTPNAASKWSWNLAIFDMMVEKG